MIANKHISTIIVAVMAAAVVLCFLAVAFSDRLTEQLGGAGVQMEYESMLFDTDRIIDIDIRIDEDEWNDLLENPKAEEYHICDVVINGRTLRDVAVRTKGNSSLAAIAKDPNSDRYSLKLEFDHFVDGQTCYGLDKLILNNSFADATNMKEAIVYDMYRYLDADASLYNYARVSVNGEYWGVYLALEAVEHSFMLRNFGTENGELYKPDNMYIGNGNLAGAASPDQEGFPGFDGMAPPSDMVPFPFGGAAAAPPFGGFPADAFNPFGGGNFSIGNGGADLNYSGDDLGNYSAIWNCEVTGTGDADHRRVVTALKHVNGGKDLERYLDVDNVLKYMAVHTFAVNMDSFSGFVFHNYYLYEYDGQLNILPWDYNLAFGGISARGDKAANSLVNDAIDTPFNGTKFFDALLEDEEYRVRYHAYLQQLTDEYVDGGYFDATYERIRSQIDPLVETDPTAFYSYMEYQTAADMLRRTIELRAESIQGQLDGSIPSTDVGQRRDSSSLIDASELDIPAMGQFNIGWQF